ncbi:cuticle protein-like [Daphnia pulicaria]|uniref:cuticle protein-like n=1 Tax=Daphnia pulicaria TaxID=35523 RepID=UPI001EECE9C6|nr:cuticle protein-like [Daphnia pulicaria]
MKVLILSIFLACASAQYYPGFYGYPATSQFHAQDVLGQASYGYAYPGQAASNYRDIFGNQVGSYAYMGPKGEVRVNYVADAVNGFRVVSNNLPVAPEDTPEVAAAKIEHAKLVKEAATKKAAEPAASRTKRQVPFYPSALPYALPYTAPYYNYVAPAPLVAKTTLKTVTAEADPSAKTPADTTKFDLKEKSFDVITPLAYPYAPYGYTYPFAAPFAAPTAVESSRKKRQVIAVPAPDQQFLDDLKYKSVDLNQNGQPDQAVVPVTPVLKTYPYYPYAALPYSGYYPTYPTAFPFYG